MNRKHLTKVCENCDGTYYRPHGLGLTPWAGRRFCSTDCKVEASRGVSVSESALAKRRGHGNSNSRLSEHQVIRIHGDHRPYPVIAAEYEIGRSQISKIKRGLSWSHLNLPYAGQRAFVPRKPSRSIGAEAHV